MVSEKEALDIVQRAFPDRRVEFFLEYRNLYLFQAFDDADEDEGAFDPYYSVDPQTGAILEFSVMTDANPVELTNLWLAKQGEEPL